MKKIIILISAFYFLTGGAYSSTITLTKDNVTSALDIEGAIYNATRGGIEYGTVILDGSKGHFTYTQPDKSINIMLSNFTLKGINGAFITNCDDGLFFDDVLVRNVTVQGIYFNCNSNGINRIGNSDRKKVILKENYFRASVHGIEMHNAFDWQIYKNTIAGGVLPGQSGVTFYSAKNTKLEKNVISGYTAIRLGNNPFNSEKNEIEENLILAIVDGIVFDKGVSLNEIEENSIVTVYMETNQEEDPVAPPLDVKDTGVFLAQATSKNKVIGNRFSSSRHVNKISIVNEGTNNTISKNKVMTGGLNEESK